MAKKKDPYFKTKAFLSFFVICIFLYLILRSFIDLKTTPLNVEILINYADQKGQFIPPPSWAVDNLKAGDEERDDKNRLLSRIIEIKSVEEGSNKIYWIKTEIQSTVNKKSGKIRFKNQPIEIGSTINFSPNSHNLDGMIIGIDGISSSEFKSVTIEGIVYGQRSHIIQSIKKDDNGDSVRIIDVFSTPSVVQQPLFPNDRVYDIHLRLELDVLIRKDVMYYAIFQPLKVGNRLWIPLPNYNLYGLVITKTSEIN